MRRNTQIKVAGVVAVFGVILLEQACGPGFSAITASSTLQSSLGNVSAAQCNADTVLPRAALRLLSNTEFDNIMADVFGSTTQYSQTLAFVVSNPGASGFTNTSIT